MRQVTLEEFRAALLDKGSYVSSPETLAPVPRPKGRWTTLSFNWSMFFVFPYCAVREFFRSLTTKLWGLCCFRTYQKAEKFGIKVTADGWENRKDYKGPVVYLANHMSTLETIMLPPILLTYGPFNVFVKASLSRLPALKRGAHPAWAQVAARGPDAGVQRRCRAHSRGKFRAHLPAGIA